MSQNPSEEIGRASCRERVQISVVAVSLKKMFFKIDNKNTRRRKNVGGYYHAPQPPRKRVLRNRIALRQTALPPGSNTSPKKSGQKKKASRQYCSSLCQLSLCSREALGSAALTPLVARDWREGKYRNIHHFSGRAEKCRMVYQKPFLNCVQGFSVAFGFVSRGTAAENLGPSCGTRPQIGN